MNNKKNIIFIGGGNMAKSMINGLLKNNFDEDNITVIDSCPQQLQNIKKEYPVNAANELINLNKDDTLIFAIKPNDVNGVCNKLRLILEDQLIISIVAGITTSKISEWLNNHKNIVRTMPNLLAKIQCSVTALYSSDQLPSNQKKIAHEIMESIGKNIWLDDESKIDAVTAISGSGPAYVFYFLESLIKSGENIGLSKEESQFLARETLLGSSMMSEFTINELDKFIAKVSSKGGTTEQAIISMKKNHFAETISIAVNEAYKRAKKIGS
tara:strand:+ start:796 stop:1602 length:807 start_codon:yes stop_codon:yes gene_type:complete